jgi:DHA1 family inner membrane transport protein
MLVLIGVGFSLGNYLGGKFADRSVSGTLKGFLLLLMSSCWRSRCWRNAGARPSHGGLGRSHLCRGSAAADAVMRVAHEAPGSLLR